jgi:hypothetical protein
VRVERIQRLYQWMFSVPASPEVCSASLAGGNFVVFPTTSLSAQSVCAACLLFFLFISQSNVLESGEDAVEPIAIIFAPFLINIAYTAGWVVELNSRRILEGGLNALAATPQTWSRFFAPCCALARPFTGGFIGS